MKKLLATACFLAVTNSANAAVTVEKTEDNATVVISEKTIKTQVSDWLTLAPEDQDYVLKQDGTVRTGPNAAFDALGVMRKGDKLKSIGRARSWVAFEKFGKTVFIWDGLLNKWQEWPSSEVQIDQE